MFIHIDAVLCRTVEDILALNGDVEEMQKIELHVITKRDVLGDYQRDYPQVDGRTFRASEPLDPNSPRTRDTGSPQNLLDGFEVQNEIFQPEVDAAANSGSNERTGEVHSTNDSDVTRGNDGQESLPTERSTADFAAQYPYSETTVAGRQYSSSGTQPYRYTGSHQSQSHYSGYQPSRTEARGSYYGGPRYIDSNGHYVDAQGRHLDSTGRYYDISGRYSDAIMTRTSAYHVSGQQTGGVGRVDGDRSGYYDNEGRYTSGSDRRYPSGGYYDSERRYVTSGGGTGYYDSQGRYVSSRTGTYEDTGASGVDSSQSRPVDSYGSTQFYSGGSRYQNTYDPVASQISDDPTCPTLNMRVTINGLSCTDAIAQLGSFVCYNYERVTTECCERCLQVKRAERTGCEYGDRSHQCRTINPYDCYNDRNRQVCCERCHQFRNQMPQSRPGGCEYGDLTPRCQEMMQRPHLCYLPENSRICCSTCPRLANSAEPECKWGNQSPELCEPFDENRRLKINCYLDGVREICCSTCKSLRERIRENIPGCEFGDAPVLFYSGSNAMTCGEYIRQYGVDTCNDIEIAEKCCYTCHRYRAARG